MANNDADKAAEVGAQRNIETYDDIRIVHESMRYHIFCEMFKNYKQSPEIVINGIVLINWDFNSETGMVSGHMISEQPIGMNSFTHQMEVAKKTYAAFFCMADIKSVFFNIKTDKINGGPANEPIKGDFGKKN